MDKRTPNCCYAVARGRSVGVFKTWKECESQVKGFKNARYKKFQSEAEALEFIRQVNSSCPGGSSVSKSDDLGKSKTYKRKSQSDISSCVPAKRRETLSNKVPLEKKSQAEEWIEEGVPVVFTDGACSSNGKHGARAGYGVFWGDDHPENKAEALEVGPPTNNRAELRAVIVALQTALTQKIPRLVVCTDSNLLIKSMTSWIKGWRKNGWKTADGSDVKNKDLILELDDLLAKVKVCFNHVNGHVGIYGNEKADELARLGASRYSVKNEKV